MFPIPLYILLRHKLKRALLTVDVLQEKAQRKRVHDRSQRIKHYHFVGSTEVQRLQMRNCNRWGLTLAGPPCC